MGRALPPIVGVDKLRQELARAPAQDRADLEQEAWLAFVEGRDVLAAVRATRWADRLRGKRDSSFADESIDAGQIAFAGGRSPRRGVLARSE